MRKALFIPLVILLLTAASPAYAFDWDLGLDFDGHASIGLGGGFGDNDVAPIGISLKYWDTWLEIGGEAYLDNDTEDHIDQLGLLWLLYRMNVYEEENNTPWMGAGIGSLIEENAFEDNFGFVAAMGWEGNKWGMEFKWGYFDPSLYSFMVYYHF